MSEAWFRSKVQSSMLRRRWEAGVPYEKLLWESGLSSIDGRGTSGLRGGVSSESGAMRSSVSSRASAPLLASAVMLRIQSLFTRAFLPHPLGTFSAGSDRVEPLLLGGLMSLAWALGPSEALLLALSRSRFSMVTPTRGCVRALLKA